jgi:lysyl-tRNA synthetase class II
MKERSCFSRPFDGKTHHGKASFAELKMLKDAYSGVCFEMIFRLMRKKQCTMWFQKTVDIGDFIEVRGTVLKLKWEKSQFMFMD